MQPILLSFFQQDFVRYLMAPLLGAVIGYFTNFIAVKMLFHPRRAWKIGKWTVPFTPGVIPKRKKKLAKAVAREVSTRLITQQDLKDVLLADSAKKTVSCGIVSTLMDSQDSVRTQLQTLLGTEKEQALLQTVSEKLSVVIAEGIGKIDLGDLLAEKGVEMTEKHFGSMLAMFLGKEKIASIARNFADGIMTYMQENGVSFLQPHVERELDAFLQKDVPALVNFCNLTPETLSTMIENAYTALIVTKADVLLTQIHLEEIVEQKMLSMDNKELEDLTLSVMKKELDTVINLGAILGALIGVFNVFFY